MRPNRGERFPNGGKEDENANGEEHLMYTRTQSESRTREREESSKVGQVLLPDGQESSFLSVKDSVQDPNPKLDEGDPFALRGISSAILFCKVMDIRIVPERRRYKSERGWDHKRLSPQTVICSWTLKFQDGDGKPT